MKNFITRFVIGSGILGLAQVASAQAVNINAVNTANGTRGLSAFITQANTIIGFIVPFMVGLAVLVVIYGVFGFISNAADEEARASAKQFIIWGVIGIFIMLSVWGLVSILDNTFSLQKDRSAIVTPRF